MRVKKNKQTRRHVRFYKACCGFREPFKVLCDGNFVHAVLNARVGSIRDALPALLGAGAKAFVTRCVIGELRKLGEEFSGTVLAARRLEIAKCDHDPLLPAVDCVEAMVGMKNPEHFFVATQDVELRRKLRKVPGGAIIFLQNTGLILEQPSSIQVSYARLSEAERLHMANREQKVLEERAKRKAAKVADAANEDTDELVQSVGLSTEDQENQNTSKPKPVSQLKRQRAKGPNPLSQKKKQKRSTDATIVRVPSKEVSIEGSVVKMKRQRRRVRHRKNDEVAVSL